MTDNQMPDRSGRDDLPDAEMDRGLVDIEQLLRSVDPDDVTRIDPPADLWSAIQAETTGIDGSAVDPIEDDVVVSLAAERRRRLSAVGATLVAAAAVLALIIGVVVTRDGGTTRLAETQLAFDADAFDPLGAEASAAASLIDDDGTLKIELEDATLPDAADADLEIWLIKPDADGNPADLVSLGLVDASDPGGFTVPAAFDPDEYFVVDISIEPRDGDAAHSGRSILRGALADA